MQNNNVVPINVFLRPASIFRMEFCMMCKEALGGIRIAGVPKLIIPSDIHKVDEIAGYTIKPIQFPLKFKCTRSFTDGSRCPALYIILGIIEE